MKKQLFLRMLIVLSLVGILAACGGATPTVTKAPVAADTEAVVATPEPTVAAPVTISLLSAQNENDRLMINALTEAYTALHPNVTFEIEIPAGTGTEVNDMVNTRLATGEMNDIFYYNSGALVAALHPADNLLDLSQEPFMANIADSFKPTVGEGTGVYGVPVGYAAAGGVLYNKKAFATLGVTVPKTWAEFEANADKIKAAGVSPVIATFGAAWTSQLFVLADFYNVAQAVPNFAADYTANKAKYATTPAAMNGFKYLREGFDKGWWQKDYATATFEQGLEMLAKGTVPQYPMLTQVMNTVAANYPDLVNDVGWYALPGPSADKNGATVWMPLAFFAPKTAKNPDVIKDFFGFVASTAGTDAMTAKVKPAGPYLIKGATLPSDVLPFVNDLNAYIDAGNSYPALEFLSPVKGPNLQQICVSVGTGQMTPEEAAAAYDLDVTKQAQQLGLPGW